MRLRPPSDHSCCRRPEHPARAEHRQIALKSREGLTVRAALPDSQTLQAVVPDHGSPEGIVEIQAPRICATNLRPRGQTSHPVAIVRASFGESAVWRDASAQDRSWLAEFPAGRFACHIQKQNAVLTRGGTELTIEALYQASGEAGTRAS